MTGLMNTASDGDLGPAPRLYDPGVAPDTEVASVPPLELEPWRDEVAARLARYRARRKPRAPRYPSLLLPFESSNNWSRHSAGVPPPSATAPMADGSSPLRESGVPPDSPLALASQDHVAAPERTSLSPSNLPPSNLPPSNLSPSKFTPPALVREQEKAETNLIEFPRSAAIPIFHTSTLADPIFDRPRIVEATEVVPAPPALGGILIEPAPARRSETRAEESRIPSASVARRLLATAIDGFILAVSFSAFAAIFMRFNPLRLPLPFLAGVACTISVALWFSYQYLFVVYTGSTPGLRATRLKMAKFDGSPVPRRLRRWRVLASMLSGFPAGLGYLWCFLDVDSLCWHDRITHTHLLAGK